MKNTPLRSIVFMLLALCSLHAARAQQKWYEVLPDAEEKKLYRGLLTVADIKGDTSFTWYQENLKYYKPNAALVEAFRSKAGKFHLMVFAGTWCHDSQAILPKYITCAEAAGLPDSVFTIVGADRQKTTLGQLHKVFNVSLVPTIIVMQEGREVGRITEYGTSGLPDADLAALISKIQ